MCLKSWQDQYNLMQDLLIQSIRRLLSILENIEKVVASSNAKEKAAKDGKCDKGKRKGTNSHDNQSQKGKSREKLRAVPEVWGHAHNS